MISVQRMGERGGGWSKMDLQDCTILVILLFPIVKECRVPCKNKNSFQMFSFNTFSFLYENVPLISRVLIGIHYPICVW